MKATEGKQALVLDGPLDGFTAREVQGLSHGRGEVDVPLLAGFAFDELDFGREAHSYLVNSLDITTQAKIQQKSARMFFYLVKGQSPAAGCNPACSLESCRHSPSGHQRE